MSWDEHKKKLSHTKVEHPKKESNAVGLHLGTQRCTVASYIHHEVSLMQYMRPLSRVFSHERRRGKRFKEKKGDLDGQDGKPSAGKTRQNLR